MSLREINEKGEMYDVTRLSHEQDFDQVWRLLTFQQRAEIETEINSRLDHLVTSPDPNWGSITNTSIEGGRTNEITGLQGDWSGTVFQPIYEIHGNNEERAGMFYGNVWKKMIIARPERWIGFRSDPTFPRRSITLAGKSYFLDQHQ